MKSNFGYVHIVNSIRTYDISRNYTNSTLNSKTASHKVEEHPTAGDGRWTAPVIAEQSVWRAERSGAE